MQRFLFGAYEDIDDIIAFLSAYNFLEFESERNISLGKTNKKYYLTEFACNKILEGLPNMPSIRWYADRCNLIHHYFGHLTGTQLKMLQYDIDEYERTTYKSYFKSIQEEVKQLYREEYGESLDEFLKNSIKNVIFETTTLIEYEELIQSFFFHQFSYYSMKWTQKDSVKDKIGQLESNASWSTYFKTIYLESKDTVKLIYGQQERLTFQMLLGFQHTYLINRLTTRRHMLEHENAKRKLVTDELLKTENPCKIEELKERKSKLQLQLTQIYEMENYKKLKSLEAEQKNKIDFTNKIIEKNRKNTLEYQRLSYEQKKLEEIIQTNKVDSEKIKSEQDKIQKEINDLTEYIEVGSFFSNLDVKHCPSCEHEIIKSSVKNEGPSCPLCKSEVVRVIDNTKFKQKVEDLKHYISQLETEFEVTKEKVQMAKNDLLIVQEKIKQCSNMLTFQNIDLTDDALQREIIQLKDALQKEKELEASIIGQIAVLDYQVNLEPNNTNTQDYGELDIKISLYNYVIDKLITERYIENKDVIEAFKSNIIDKNIGHHTRLLIIDSPGKEEGDKTYIDGLIKILDYINDKYRNELQIIVGTAERRIENKIKNQLVIPNGKFVF